MHFPGLEKSWMLGKMAVVMEESCNFIFWSKYSMLFENWKHLLVIVQKYAPQKAGFSAFFWSWKLKLVMEKSLDFIA